MIATGFTKPVVIDSLVAEGVDREQAKAIVTEMLKAKFRRNLAASADADQQSSLKWIVVGVGLMLWGGIPIGDFLLRLAKEGEARFFTIWWVIFTGGFFVFLFGITRRKRK